MPSSPSVPATSCLPAAPENHAALQPNSALSRRQLVAATALAARGLPVAAVAAAGSTATRAPAAQAEAAGEPPPSTWPRLGRKLRVGVVGLEGHPGLVLDVTAQHPDLELVAIARDTVPVDGVKRRPQFQNTRIYNDFREMLDREQLDIVGACNTNGRRAAVMQAAIAKGCHVVAEKPVALSAEELRAVRQAVSRPGIAFTSLLPMRYEPALYTMGMLVREGAIGNVLLMSGQKSYKLGSRPDWFKNRELYGSTMLWIGVHQLDLMHWVSGLSFTAVYSYEQNVQAPGYGEMENICGAVLHLQNGGVATLSMDYHRPDAANSHGDDRLRVVGTKGILEYRLADGLMLLSERGKALEKPTLRRPPLPLFMDFLQETYLGKPMLIRPQEVFHVVETLIAARQSDATGQRVEV